MKIILGTTMIIMSLINIMRGVVIGFIYLFIGIFFLWQGWDPKGEKIKKYIDAYINVRKKKKKRK